MFQPLVTPPFTMNGQFFCKTCNSYSDDFTKSNIKYQFRRCRPCHKTKRTPEPIEDINRIKRSLTKKYRYLGWHDIARGITREAVESIINYHGINPELVHRLNPPVKIEEVSNIAAYIILNFSLLFGLLKK